MSDARRVAFVHVDLADGGAQRQTLLLARHLDPARYRARIVCLRGDGRLVAAARVAGRAVDVLDRLRRPWDGLAAVALARALRRDRATVVQVPRYSRAVPYAALAARLARVPLLVVHDHALYGRLPFARRLADGLLLRDARYVAVAEAVRGALRGDGIAEDRIATVLPGIELARFAAGRGERGRASLGIAADVPLILVPARLHPMKRHVDLLAAMPRVLAAHPTAVVVCAGDGPLRAPLTALAYATGLSPAVRYLGARDDLVDLFAAATVVALPSRAEGLPAALIEAAAAGRPVVATAVGGVPELVVDGLTGWLVPPEDPSALATALIAALADPAACARAGDAARQLASERFAIGAAAGRLQDAWDGWLAEGPHGR